MFLNTNSTQRFVKVSVSPQSLRLYVIKCYVKRPKINTHIEWHRKRNTESCPIVYSFIHAIIFHSYLILPSVMAGLKVYNKKDLYMIRFMWDIEITSSTALVICSHLCMTMGINETTQCWAVWPNICIMVLKILAVSLYFTYFLFVLFFAWQGLLQMCDLICCQEHTEYERIKMYSYK